MANKLLTIVLPSVALVLALILGFVWLQNAGPARTQPLSAGITGINLVSARDLGCSPDFFTGPDLDVSIYLDGKLVLSGTGHNEREPLFAKVVGASPRAKSVVRVVVSELEPGGSLACDVDPGSATAAEFSWDGREMTKILRGAGDRAAEVVLVLGKIPGSVGSLQAFPETTSVRLDWVPPATSPDNLHIARGETGEVAKTLAGNAGRADFGPLCDNQRYTVRVIAQTGDWWVGQATTFTTKNVPPQPARILKITGSPPVVEFEHTDRHDLASFDVLVGPKGFDIGSATVRSHIEASSTGFRTQRATLQAGDQEVVIKTTDTGSLTSYSPRFAVGDPAQEETRFDTSCDGHDPLSARKDYDTPAGFLIVLAGLGVAVVSRRHG